MKGGGCREGLGAAATRTPERSKRELRTHRAEPAAAALMHLGMYPHPGAKSGNGVAVGEAALREVGVSAAWTPHEHPTASPGLAGVERTSKPAKEVFWKINQSN